MDQPRPGTVGGNWYKYAGASKAGRDQPMPLPRLIVDADDYAATPAISDGILQAHDHGLVTSTSVMACGLNAHWASELLSRPDLGACAHLTLTFGEPSLGKLYRGPLHNGLFPSRFRWGLQRCYELDSAAILDEFRAQLEGVMQMVPVTGLDTHHHIHELPEVFEVVLRLAQDYGVAVRALDAVQRAACIAAGVTCPDIVLTELWGTDGSVGTLRNVLQRVTIAPIAAGAPDAPNHAMTGRVGQARKEPVIELVCHPGYNYNLPAHGDFDGSAIERELQTLTSLEAIEWVAHRFLPYHHAVSYGD